MHPVQKVTLHGQVMARNCEHVCGERGWAGSKEAVTTISSLALYHLGSGRGRRRESQFALVPITIIVGAASNREIFLHVVSFSSGKGERSLAGRQAGFVVRDRLS